ncbi:MAG: isoprenylcysteine carboxylmethyltransferase family protein [Oscillospiraceae bacterium]|nr:isoprenylcysteine carboxylmethyltransferase family protein [Oscillospiraceae bacterium]
MTFKLFLQAIGKLVLGMLSVALLTFLPAGTLHFPNGWLLMAILFVPMFLAGLVLMVCNPKLLQRRLNAKETQKEQRLVVSLSALVFLAGFLVSGLDFRFGWSHLPQSVVIIAVIIFLAAYLLYAEVIRENTYLSRTIEVQEAQKVIDTGLYSVIRHPMYTATIFLFLSMPLILGSIWGFFVFLIHPILIVRRIKFEEEFLTKELPGYLEYRQTVAYRLIPFLW